MAIEKIAIKNSPIFVNPTVMENLKPINFIFGDNGTGKTTIGRLLKNLSDPNKIEIEYKGKQAFEIKVFNSDYIFENFLEIKDLPGVFTIGKKNTDAVKKAEKLREKIEDLEKQEKIVSDDLDRRKSNLSVIQEQIVTMLWGCRTKLTNFEYLKKAFEGFLSPKQNFTDRFLGLIGKYGGKDAASLEELEREAETIYGSSLEGFSNIQRLDDSLIRKVSKDEVLAKKIVGKEDLNISGLIARLGNSDWVKEGTKYLSQSDDVCPFCQQRLTASFKKEINSFFDEEYEKEITTLQNVVSRYSEETARIITEIESWINRPELEQFYDTGSVKSDFEKLKRVFEGNRNAMERKSGKPSESISLESTNELIDGLNKAIDAANEKIEERNDIFERRATLKNQFPAKVVQYFLNEMESSFEELRSQEAAQKTGVEKVNQEVSGIQSEITTATDELTNVSKAASDTEKVKDDINNLLKKRGFKNFEIKTTEDGSHYQVVRPNGEPVAGTLSEGERNMLSFAYFYLSLEGNQSNKKLIIFIDDPVSSLDNDSLFFVVSMIQKLKDDIKQGNNNYSQLFVATHNFHFYKEITFGAKKDTVFKYWTVEKAGDKSIVKSHASNPVATLYRSLWDNVKKAKNGVAIDSQGLQNTMRRILECFFSFYYEQDGIINVKTSVMNMIDDPNDRLVVNSLMLWVNDGSHSFLSDDSQYASGTEIEVDVYLRVLELVFDKCGHKNHYDEMMNQNGNPQMN